MTLRDSASGSGLMHQAQVSAPTAGPSTAFVGRQGRRLPAGIDRAERRREQEKKAARATRARKKEKVERLEGNEAAFKEVVKWSDQRIAQLQAYIEMLGQPVPPSGSPRPLCPGQTQGVAASLYEAASPLQQQSVEGLGSQGIGLYSNVYASLLGGGAHPSPAEQAYHIRGGSSEMETALGGGFPSLSRQPQFQASGQGFATQVPEEVGQDAGPFGSRRGWTPLDPFQKPLDAYGDKDASGEDENL